jgi:hypothetical protein
MWKLQARVTPYVNAYASSDCEMTISSPQATATSKVQSIMSRNDCMYTFYSFDTPFNPPRTDSKVYWALLVEIP